MLPIKKATIEQGLRDHWKVVESMQIFDYAGPSAYKYLRTWFNVHGLWSKPASYIFPNVVTSGKGKTTQLYFNECVSKKWYERQLDAMLTAIGEDPKKYSVHSLRAGGATELFLAGASLAVVQNLGTPVH